MNNLEAGKGAGIETSSKSGVAEARIAELANDAIKKEETPAQAQERHQRELVQEDEILAGIKNASTEASGKAPISKEKQNEELRIANEKSFAMEAEIRNASRSWLDKLTGRNKVDADDVMRYQAGELNQEAQHHLRRESASERVDKVVSDLPFRFSPFKTKEDITTSLSIDEEDAVKRENEKMRKSLNNFTDEVRGFSKDVLTAIKSDEKEKAEELEGLQVKE